MAYKNKKKRAQSPSGQEGFTMIEVLLAVVILSIFMGAAVGLFLSTLAGTQVSESYVRANFLAREGLEAMRAIRDSNFLNLKDGAYGLIRGRPYQLGPSPEAMGEGFERSMTIEPVYRDGNFNISPVGSLDPYAKRVTSHVAFSEISGIRREVALTTYLTNWGGREMVHALKSDFSEASSQNISIVSASPPPLNNGALKLSMVFTADGFLSSANIGEHGNSVVIRGFYAFVTTAKAQQGLAVVDMSDSKNLSVVQAINLGGKGNGIALADNIAVIGVENTSRGLAVVDVSASALPILLGSVDIGGIGKKLALANGFAFVTTSNKENGLAVVDISNPGNPSLVAKIGLGGDGDGVAVYGQRLFVGVSGGIGTKVFDISNPRSPSLIQTFNMGGGYATGFAFDFPYVYLSEADHSDEFFVGRLNDQGILTKVTSMHLFGGQANAISKYGDMVTVAGDDENRGVVLLDVSEPSAPAVRDNKDIDAKAIALASAPPYIGVATNTANRGFVLLGSGNQGYAGTGEYISQPVYFGTSYPEYLTLQFEAIEPPASSVKIYLRSARTISELNTAQWVGPYAVSPSRLSLLSAPYLQYRIVLSGDSYSSPLFESIIIQYLP